MANHIFTAADVMPLFTESKPVLCVADIAKAVGCSDKETREHLPSLINKGFIKKHKIEGRILFSIPTFNGCIEDFTVALKPDSECASFVWPKEILKERNHWMELATQFHKILSKNNMDVIA